MINIFGELFRNSNLNKRKQNKKTLRRLLGKVDRWKLIIIG